MSAPGSGGDNRKSVLFVCLGNICRSPLAEGVFLDLIRKRPDRNEWKVDSCATESWNVGSPPDSRALQVLKAYGINDYKHTARQIRKEDFKNFHYIFGMDSGNMSEIKSMIPSNFIGKVSLLGKYDDQNPSGIIRDPYYDYNNDGFEEAYNTSRRACEAFLNKEGL